MLLLPLLAAAAPREKRTPVSPPVVAPTKSSLVKSHITTPLLLDTQKRGKDQRHKWVRVIASTHPTSRFAIAAVAAACISLHLTREAMMYDQDCKISSLKWFACDALYFASIGSLISFAVAVIIITSIFRGAREEKRDTAITDELLAAAMSSAAYAPQTERLIELRARGVESGNWQLDEKLSTDTVAVFHNPHTQTALIAFRGSATMSDWVSNLRRVVPGDEERSSSFTHSLHAARAAQLKYAFYRDIWLTGHSRGGSMADFVGRKLGLPSLQINPGTWGRLFKAEEPAVSSVTTRTADLISLLEAVRAKDRKVHFRWPKRQIHQLFIGISLLTTCLVILNQPRLGSSWAKHIAVTCLAACVAWYLVWIHSVLRFTHR